jgi:hypothetical protein
MKLHRLGKSLFGKAALATAALSGLLFFAGAPGAQAADRDDGHRRVVQTDRSYSDRGYYNRQTDQPRLEYREGFERPNRDYRNSWNRDRDDHQRFDRDRGRDRW